MASPLFSASSSQVFYYPMSNGSEEEIGTGASVKRVSTLPQTSSASRISISTSGRDDEEYPVSFVTVLTAKATIPRLSPLRLPSSGP